MKRKTNKKNYTKSRKNNKYKTWNQSGFKIRQLGENCFMADVCLFGERERKCFKTKGEAEEHCKQKKQEAINKGTDAFAIPDQDRLDVIQARKLLGDVPLLETVRFYLRHNKPVGGTRTVEQLIQEYMESMNKLGRRPDTVKGARWRIDAFSRTFGKRQVHEITTSEIEAWLDKNGWQGLNCRHYLAVVHAFFQFAVKQKLISLNPSAAIDKPIVEQIPPEIMSPKTIKTLLHTAEQLEPSLIPSLIISFIAGLRPNEVTGLEWKDVLFEEKLIRVIPSVAKMRRQRLVEISDNLLTWLLKYRREDDHIWPLGSTTYQHKKTRLLKAAKVSLPYNAGRHAFASYHLAKNKSPEKTSLQLGHSNPNMLFSTYRGLVTEKAAADFWNIRPKQAGKIIKLPAVG